MTISVSEASRHNANAIIDLWQRSELTRPWNDPASDFVRALENPTSTVLLAEDGGTLVGTVMAGYDGHRGWLYYLATDPGHRKQGIAKCLIDAAENWLAARGCPKVELMVRTGNPAAGFYENTGWDKQDVTVYARWLDKKDI